MVTIVRLLRWVRHHVLPANFKGKSALRRTYGWLVRLGPWLWKDRGVPVDIGGCGTFEVDPQVAFGRYEDWGSGHNSGLKAWVETCAGKQVVFDIGAHIGLYSLPASKAIAATGRIYAFEPAKRNASILATHLRYNKLTNVEVLPCVVGETDAAKTLFFERDDQVDAMNAVMVRKNVHLYKQTWKMQVSIDSFCRNRGIAPEVIKIDVEGAEAKVLQGGRDVLTHDRPVVFLSVHPGRLEALEDSPEKVAAIVERFGYVAYDTDGRRVTQFGFDEYILVPAERASGVGDAVVAWPGHATL